MHPSVTAENGPNTIVAENGSKSLPMQPKPRPCRCDRSTWQRSGTTPSRGPRYAESFSSTWTEGRGGGEAIYEGPDTATNAFQIPSCLQKKLQHRRENLPRAKFRFGVRFGRPSAPARTSRTAPLRTTARSPRRRSSEAQFSLWRFTEFL